jgi:hypothetical protein
MVLEAATAMNGVGSGYLVSRSWAGRRPHSAVVLASVDSGPVRPKDTDPRKIQPHTAHEKDTSGRCSRSDNFWTGRSILHRPTDAARLLGFGGN